MLYPKVKEEPMSKRQASVVKLPAKGKALLAAADVLAKLRELIIKTHSPIVQECLREARKEIAYLTATEGPFAIDEDAYEEMSDEDVIKGNYPAKKAESRI